MRELTEKEEYSLYSICLQNGLDIHYGKLSLCNLSNHKHSQVIKNRKYQVHCDDSRSPLSKIYWDLETAIKQFIEIKKLVPPRTKG